MGSVARPTRNAQLFENADRRAHRSLDVPAELVEEVRLGHGGPQAGDRHLERTDDVVQWTRARGRVAAS